MIFVTLGTQDKSFDRLLAAIDREINNGNIKEKVIVQAGHTKYESDNMEVFDLIAPDKFEEYIDKADLIITHGGAGSILTAVKKGKKIIAAPRLKKYKEHTNDHQKEIIEEFVKEGYVLGLNDFNKLDKVLEKAKNFKPKKFVSNTENMIKLVSNYIEEENHTSWYNKTSFIFKYLIFYLIYFLIYRIMIKILYSYDLDFIIRKNIMIIAIFVFIFISYFSSKYIVYRKKDDSFGEAFIRMVLFIISNFMVIILCGLLDNLLITNILTFIITCLVNRYLIFNNRKLEE